MNTTTSKYYDVFELSELNRFNTRLQEMYEQTNTLSGWQTTYVSKSDGRLKHNSYIKEILNRVGQYVTSDGGMIKLTKIDAISDCIEINQQSKVLSLLEIKCHTCFGSRSPLGDMFHRIRTESPSIKNQWDALVKTDLPYCIFIGYHWLPKQDCTVDNLKNHDMTAICLIGKGNKFAILQDSLNAFDHTICAKTIMRLLSELVTYDKQQVLAYTDTVSEDLFWLHNESKLLSQLSQLALPENIQQPEPMPEPTTKSIDDYSTQELINRRLSGELQQDIVTDLKSKGYISSSGQELTSPILSHKLPPKETWQIDFNNYQDQIKQAFTNALLDGGKISRDSLSDQDVIYLIEFLFAITGMYYTDSKVIKWFNKHPQSSLFLDLKHQAISEFNEQGTLFEQPKATIKHDALENIQSTLNVILDKLLELESDQNKLKELDQTVHILMDTIERHIK